MSSRARLGMLAIGALVLAAAAGGLMLQQTADRADVNPITDRQELDRTGREALRLVNFDAARVGYAISFEPGRPGVRAQTDRATKRVSVFLRHGDSPTVVAHDVAHELGHAYDDARMVAADRGAYLARRGAASVPWEPDGASDYAVGAGDFAEVFALCHSASPDFRGRLAPRPVDACVLLPSGAR